MRTVSHSREDPSGIGANDNDSNICPSQQSTDSSKGRKLRQVLQKKQLDVLLQTYSSYIDEPEESGTNKNASDFFAITRKKSIEGNPMGHEIEDFGKSIDEYSVDKKYQSDASPDMALLRSSKSLLSDEDDYTSAEDQKDTTFFSSDEEFVSDDGVSDYKRYRDTSGRKAKKKPMTRRKKRGDFTARLLKANDVLASFGTRCTQKHLEIAADFQEATKELRYHIKSGANIAFEDFADHFDGIVENLFVGDNEQRDDDGERKQRDRRQGTSYSSSTQRQQNSQRDGHPNIRPLTHEETIMAMNKQVSELLEPVAAFTDKVQDLTCNGTLEGFELYRPEQVGRSASF